VRAVDLNFSAAPFRNNTPYYLGYGIAALVVGLFTFYNAWAYIHFSRGNDTLGQAYAENRAKLESLRREATDLQAKIDKIDLGSMNGRAAFTNSLLERRRFSWTNLLNSLEEAQVYQVRLLSLLPRIQEKGIIIDARAVAHDLKSMWNFQQNLQLHPKFRRVYPGGWTKSTEQGEIVFNLAFNYFPEGAPEGAQGPTPQEAGLADFVEAPGPGGESAEDVENTDDAPAEEPPTAPKKPSRTAAGSALVPAPPGAAPAQAPAPHPPPPGGRGASVRNSAVPGAAPANAAGVALDAAAPASAPAPGAAGTFATGRPSIAGFPTVAPPGGASGPVGASGAQRPHFGRGLPPGSHGVRPTPPPKTDVPTVPLTPPSGGSTGDPGDDQ